MAHGELYVNVIDDITRPVLHCNRDCLSS